MASLNCDMGESFGLYKMGEDEKIAPYISVANVACGFHASDPNHMKATVLLAKQHNIKVGAHPSLPDLAGFGRREMKIEREELANLLIYQIAALTGFLRLAGLPLNHIKPHGSLYGMAARDPAIANAVCDAAEIFKVPIMGMAGTYHEQISKERGFGFISEFFADLDYNDDGGLIITRQHTTVDPDKAAQRVARAITEGLVDSVNGKPIKVTAETVCIHSDTPNALSVAKAVNEVLATI